MLILQLKHKLKNLLSLILPGVVFLFLICLPPNLSFGDEIVAIVNKDLNLQEKLSINDLRLIFQGRKKTWKNGKNILIILPPFQSKPMEFLVSQVFRFNTEVDVSRFYLKAVFQQVFINPPKPVIDIHYSIAEVAAAPGGIALIEVDKIPEGSEIAVVHLGE